MYYKIIQITNRIRRIMFKMNLNYINSCCQINFDFKKNPGIHLFPELLDLVVLHFQQSSEYCKTFVFSIFSFVFLTNFCLAQKKFT